MLASQEGHLSVVKKLLEAKAEVNKQRHDGVTALMSASFFGKETVVKLLLENKANVDKYSQDKFTPLMFAVKSGSNEIVKLLLKKGANPNIKNSNGKQAIDYAESKEIKDMLSQEASSPTDYSPIQMK